MVAFGIIMAENCCSARVCRDVLGWQTARACLPAGSNMAGELPSTNSILSTTLGKVLQGRANRSLPTGVVVHAS